MGKKIDSPRDYGKLLSENLHSKEQLKIFANSLAKLESESQFVPKRVLVNGQPYPELLSAIYELKEVNEIGSYIEHFLGSSDLATEVLINGKPGLPFDLRVNINVNGPNRL